MSDFEKLKQMDEQEVFKKTYIAPKIITCLKEENFKELGSRSRTLGFISIIERQLGLDLSDLRQKAEEYFANYEEEHNHNFHIPEGMAQKRKRPFIKIIILLLIAAGVYYLYLMQTKKQTTTPAPAQSFFSSSSSLSSSSSSSTFSSTTPSSVVAIAQSSSLQQSQEEVQSSSSSLVLEHNSTVAQADEESIVQSSSSSSEVAALSKVVIIPKQKVWVGIIYLDNYKKKQLLTSSPIELNISRDQLIVTGHGKLQIDVNGEIKDFDTVKKQRFIYQAGNFKAIDRATFKLYNRGKDW